MLRRKRRTITIAPDRTSACAAPSSSLYFYPDGTVLTCCVNVDHVIGRVGESSIREMWDGSELRRLREALAVGDFSLGCQRCDGPTVPGGLPFSHARQFDTFNDRPLPSYPRRMDFVLSNRCNLQCIMCNGDLSSSIRAQREGRPALQSPYDDGFFDELREFLPHLEVAFFLGGEPFLAREAQRVWDLMIELGLTIPVFVVTNGTQWSPRVEHYLSSLNMGLSVSIDGATAATTAAIRVGADRDRILANIDRYRAILEPKGGNVVLNYCLMNQNWGEFRAFLADADERGIEGRVVTVTDPHEFSLYALPDDELEVVVETLEGERTDRPDPTSNDVVFDTEVARLRHHLDQRRCRLELGADNWAEAYGFLVAADQAGLDATVLMATEPAERDLRLLDADELARIADSLDGHRRAGPPLGRNSVVWDRHVAPLLQIVAERRADLAAAEASFEAACAELATWCGHAPIVVDVLDDVVDGTRSPIDPPAGVDPAAWSGERADLIPTHLSPCYGPLVVGDPAALPDGTLRVDLIGAAGSVVARVAVLTVSDRRTRLAVALADPSVAVGAP